MKILITMAGDAKRFQDTEFPPYKPFIEVNGKTILDWTLFSIPNIRAHDICFAIREDHDKLYDVKKQLKGTYPDCHVVKFFQPTRGNLETAMLSVMQWMPDDTQEPLLIMDSDNFFNGMHLLRDIKTTYGTAKVFAFEPKDDSDKWCFALPETTWKVSKRVHSLMEKDRAALNKDGKPMVGVFYFARASWFLMAAAHVIADGITARGEFYMSQSIDWLARVGVPVGCVMVNDVVPLGEPADVRHFSKGSYERPISEVPPQNNQSGAEGENRGS